MPFQGAMRFLFGNARPSDFPDGVQLCRRTARSRPRAVSARAPGRQKPRPVPRQLSRREEAFTFRFARI